MAQARLDMAIVAASGKLDSGRPLVAGHRDDGHLLRQQVPSSYERLPRTPENLGGLPRT